MADSFMKISNLYYQMDPKIVTYFAQMVQS